MSKHSEQIEREHHPYSPSTLQYLEACPCYQGRQDGPINKRATAGTLAHKVTETGTDENALSDEDAAAAAECMDFYEKRRQELERDRLLEVHQLDLETGIGWEAADTEVPKLIELTEAYFPIDDCVFDDCKATTAGYVDRAIIMGNYAALFDWKFGIWPVEKAENNLQGIAYALGLFKTYPEVETVSLTFKQPHINFVTTAVFAKEQIPGLYLRIQTVVARAREARARKDFLTANPAVPVCNFCANIGVCPKVAVFACKVGSKFYPLEIPESITPTQIQDPHQTSLGMRLASVLATWATAFKAQTAARVIRMQADLPDGYTLQSRNGDRKITDMAKYKQAAMKYLEPAEYESALTVSLGAVEDLISEKSPRGQKKANIEAFKQQLEESGAIEKGEPFAFLRADTKGKTE